MEGQISLWKDARALAGGRGPVGGGGSASGEAAARRPGNFGRSAKPNKLLRISVFAVRYNFFLSPVPSVVRGSFVVIFLPRTMRNRPYPVLKTIEGSRTMRNRPYPVCSSAVKSSSAQESRNCAVSVQSFIATGGRGTANLEMCTL